MLTNDIGIDLGTANTLVYKKGKGIILREPSVVAMDIRTGDVILAGAEAKEMIGRTPANILVTRPLREGVIADFHTTSAMLTYFIKKAIGSNPFMKTRVVICIPSDVTPVERRAVEEAAMKSGAKEIYIVEELLAAAIGAGLPVDEAAGSMIVDIGGGTSEVAVISLGGIVTSNSIRVAGDKFDEAIASLIKKKYNILIGERTAEEIKLSIGSAYPYKNEECMSVRGRDLISGLPANAVVTAAEIREALFEPLNVIIEVIKATFETTPPELSSDIIERGITVTGGGALLRGIDRLIRKHTQIRTFVSDCALDCVAIGAGRMLENIEMLSKLNVVARR